MYCNQECLTKARERFHGTYCRDIDLLHDEYNESAFMARISTWKSLVESLYITEDPLILKSLMISNKRTTIFDYDFRKHQQDSSADFINLSIFNNLEAHAGEDIETHRKEISSDFIQTSPKLKKICYGNPEMESLLVDYSTRLAMIRDQNSVAVSVGEQKFGSAILPFASLYSHSCDTGSIYMIYIDSKFVHIVLKPIKRGEQVFFNYG